MKGLSMCVLACLSLFGLGCMVDLSGYTFTGSGTTSTSSSSSTTTSSTSTTSSTNAVGGGGEGGTISVGGGGSGGAGGSMTTSSSGGAGGQGGAGGSVSVGGQGGGQASACTVNQPKPTVTFLPINEPLHNGLNTVLRLEVTTDPDCPIGVREFQFKFVLSAGLSIDVVGITPFSVNGVEGASGAQAAVMGSDSNALAIVTYVNDDQVVESGTVNPQPYVLELKVNVSGVVSGSTIRAAFSSYGVDVVGNIVLVGSLPPGQIVYYPVMHQYGSPYGAGFIWTDFAAGPTHKPSAGSPYSSPDYFTGNGVAGIDGSALLQAP